MKTYRWLTLSAAIVITMLEVFLFTGASAVAASPSDALTPVVMVAATTGNSP